jgi:hypothetical protein
MAYMTRLGLWGIGTSFPNGFNQFLTAVNEGTSIILKFDLF